MTLFLSTLTTIHIHLGESAYATASAAGADADPERAISQANHTAEQVGANKRFAVAILILVLSFFITLVAGWSKIFSYERKLKDWDKFFADHPEKEETPALGKLQEVLVQLAPAPKDRLRSYDEFMQEFDPWTKSIEWPQVAPGDWMSTLKQIRKHYPEIWDLIFLKYYENGGHTRRRRKLKGLLNTDRSVDVACGTPLRISLHAAREYRDSPARGPTASGHHQQGD